MQTPVDQKYFIKKTAQKKPRLKLDNKARKRRITQNPRIVKINDHGRPAGLAKSKKIIRAMNEKEAIFMKLCSQIRLEDCKKERAENQKKERKLKRN